VEWVGFELHPETPAEGVRLSTLIPGFDPGAMAQRLSAAGAPYGISFSGRELVSNSRLALEAAEFAGDQGRFDDLHSLIFRAYFQEGRDIGSLAAVLAVAAEAGLDTGELRESLAQGLYRGRLQAARERGEQYQVTGLPTFIFNGSKKIVGAQPYDVFVNVVKQFLQHHETGGPG